MSNPIDPPITTVGDPEQPQTPADGIWPASRVRRIPKHLRRPFLANHRKEDEKAASEWKRFDWRKRNDKGQSGIIPGRAEDGGDVFTQPAGSATCTSMAVAAALRSYFRIYKSKTKRDQCAIATDSAFNPYFLYGMARERLFTTDDPRSAVINTLAVANQYGTPIGLSPPANFPREVPFPDYRTVAPGSYTATVRDEIIALARPQTLKASADLGIYLGDWYKWLTTQGPVVVLMVTEQEKFAQLNKSNAVVDFQVDDSVQSEQVTSRYAGHCALLVGWKADTQRFVIQNSFGVEWGDQGFAEVPLDVAKRCFLAGYGLVVGEQLVRKW